MPITNEAACRLLGDLVLAARREQHLVEHLEKAVLLLADEDILVEWCRGAVELIRLSKEVHTNVKD